MRSIKARSIRARSIEVKGLGVGKWLVVMLLLLWASQPLIAEIPKIYHGMPFVYDYIRGMFPPEFSILPQLWQPLVETLQVAVTSIFLAALIALPVSFLAAKETAPNLLLYMLSTSTINFLRTMPTLLWAILFVAMVGLGPLAGVFALTAHCIGALGKYFQEAIEVTVPAISEVLEAMRIDGANEWQVMRHGVFPAVAPLFASYVMYYLEWCVRVGTTLGLVGAGGVGLQLTQSIRLFRRQQTLAIVILILCMVFAINFSSRIIRKGLVDG